MRVRRERLDSCRNIEPQFVVIGLVAVLNCLIVQVIPVALLNLSHVHQEAVVEGATIVDGVIFERLQRRQL